MKLYMTQNPPLIASYLPSTYEFQPIYYMLHAKEAIPHALTNNLVMGQNHMKQ